MTMNTKTSLVSLFNKDKETLEKQLEGLSLPKDAERIQKTISNYFSNLFESDGEFRQQLTIGEDYILQAALSLLDAQKDISKALIKKTTDITISAKTPQSEPLEKKGLSLNDFLNTPINGTNSLLASGGGALIGSTILGGWGAVCGSIAGTAIVIYLSYTERQKTSLRHSTLEVSDNTLLDISTPVNVKELIEIINKICESVDSLIETFRAQINKVINKYESREKPTLEKEFRSLLEELQSLIGYERTHSESEEKYMRKLKERIEDIVETLENYNLEVIEYSPENSFCFEQIPSPNTKELRMAYPAILKNGNVVLPGKIFVPE